MSACHYCHHPASQTIATRPQLFNWVTALLLTGWVGIVSLAFEMSSAANLSAVPTLEVFLKTLF